MLCCCLQVLPDGGLLALRLDMELGALVKAVEEDWLDEKKVHDSKVAQIKLEIERIQEESRRAQAHAEESRQKLQRVEASVTKLTQTIREARETTQTRRRSLMESASNFHGVRLRLMSASAEKAGGLTRSRKILEETLMNDSYE